MDLNSINQSDLWFSTPVSGSLCRGGGNGPVHPSQLVGLSFVDAHESLLDVGCGSGTTIELIRRVYGDSLKYKGVDFVEKHVKWCQETFPKEEFEQQNAMKLLESDGSWDVVWSRHVVDHLPSFEMALDEQLRVAKKMVICILFVGFSNKLEHSIKNIFDHNKLYKSEYRNEYSRDKVMTYLAHTRYKYRIIENIGLRNKESDIVIAINKEGK